MEHEYEHQETAQWLADYMRAGADNPDKCGVDVIATASGRTASFTPSCDGNDAAKFIGAKGATVKALGILLAYRGRKRGYTYALTSIRTDPARKSGRILTPDPDWDAKRFADVFDAFCAGLFGGVRVNWSGSLPLVVTVEARVAERERETVGSALQVVASALAASMRGEVVVELEGV